MDKSEKISVWLFSGFLGSGKTTVIQALLKQYPETRFYLIENEIGEISIDGAILKQQVQQLVEVSGGCICCTLDYAFRDTMAELSTKIHSENKQLNSVAVIIETTGLADPAQIRAAFSSDEFLQSQFDIKALITCLNIQQAETLLHEESQVRQLAARQLTAADIILLTRADIAESTRLQHASELIQYWNPWAIVWPVESGQLPIPLFTVKLKEKLIPYRLRNEDLLEQASQFAQVEIFQPEYVFDLMAFLHRMTVLCKVQGDFLYRIKGWIQVANDPRKYWVQSAGKECWIQAGEVWTDEKPTSCLVFIGIGLQRAPWERVLYSCRSRTE